MPNPVLGVNRLVVQAISPVHIGTGVRLGAFDYVRQGDEVIVLDEDKLMAWAAADASGRRALDLTQLIERDSSLAAYLEQRGEKTTRFEAYRLKAATDRRIAGLMPFVRMSDHAAYLPGSSLKGSLRSALQRGRLMADGAQRQRVDGLVREAARRKHSASEAAQAEVFVPAREGLKRGAYPNYDLNRLLGLGDSEPIQADLEAVEIQTLSVAGDALRPKHYSLFAETLPMGTRTSLPVTWNAYLLDDLAATLRFASVQDLMLFLPEYCRAASRSLLEQEVRFYRGHGHSDLAGWYEQKRDDLDRRASDLFYLPLGWGSGYDAKTVTDLLSRAAFEAVADNLSNTKGLGRAGNNRSNPWLGPDLSPKSRKVVIRPSGEALPMGWMVLAFRARQGEHENWLMDMRQAHQDLRPQFESAPPAITPGAPPVEVRTPPPATLDTALPPPQPAAEPSAPPRRPPPAETRKPLVERFSALPAAADRFRGVVVSTEPDGTIYLEMPGLSGDDLALGVVTPENNPERRKFKEGATITCEVLGVEPDPDLEGHWLVQCRRE